MQWTVLTHKTNGGTVTVFGTYPPKSAKVQRFIDIVVAESEYIKQECLIDNIHILLEE